MVVEKRLLLRRFPGHFKRYFGCRCLIRGIPRLELVRNFYEEQEQTGFNINVTNNYLSHYLFNIAMFVKNIWYTTIYVTISNYGHFVTL